MKRNIPLGIGLLLLSGTLITSRYVNMPDNLHLTLLLCAIGFELWGIISIARSPEMKNSKLRRWKMRLIGREVKDEQTVN